MRFAEPLWLFGTGFGLVVAGFLVVGALLLVRAIKRFGDEARVLDLVTNRASHRRALKGALLVLAVALAFVALAKPQYGRGTRLIPATNLDVVLVLDYSKSMYARDVKPSRIMRAKTEVASLISSLPGARFGAVAFAGQPMSFPLTSDGGAIGQFFRQLSPSDMPIGGTAIARALEAGRELLARDPLSSKHRRVIVLVTDGEDLEGDPVQVAQAAKAENTTIHVVQIGGRTPEPLPEMNEAGEVTGWRTDETGQPITTSLSADGEAQLGRIAEVSGGRVIRSERGSTGLAEIERSLKQMMTEELSERVETVYADVFMYPLSAAVLLLLVETFIGDSRRRKRPSELPKTPRKIRRKRSRDVERAALASFAALLAALVSISGCNVDELFTRNAPDVDRAIAALDAGDAAAAAQLLQDYLSTGACKDGQMGASPTVREKPNAGFDLGLALFQIAEQFGRRFGEEELGDGGATPEEEARLAQRRNEISCALLVTAVVAPDASVALDLRARAHYLSGNLNFLQREYRAAVDSYDAALKLIPGQPLDAGFDSIGRDAAWNRAIALRRIEEQQPPDAGPDAEPDASPDAEPDAAPDAAPDAEPDAGEDGGDSGSDGGDDQPDAGNDGGDNQPDGGNDGGDQNQSQPDGGADAGNDGGAPPPQDQQSSSANQDERMLDMLEQAPTLQEEVAKSRAVQGRVSGMQDK